MKLARDSDGLLPLVIDPAALRIATVRCSHTTSTLRCMIGAPRSMHADLAGEDGCVSAAIIVERQPSMAEPMRRGMPYTVISHELSRACPGLMGMLAITGNADHATARVATTLQLLKRVCTVGRGQLRRCGVGLEAEEAAWNHAQRIVCVGMPADFKMDSSSYTIGSRQPRSRGRSGELCGRGGGATTTTRRR